VDDFAELSLIPPLPYGRATALFAWAERQAGARFGACNSLAATVVRYDGLVSACCNERVIMEQGPARLRRRCGSGDEVGEAVDDFRSDPLLNVIGGMGAGALTQVPPFADLAEAEFPSICELCWALQRRAGPLGDESARLVTAMAVLGRGAKQ
jgi:hypothetical protein